MPVPGTATNLQAGGLGEGAYPILSLGGAATAFSGFTWSQLYALPTDPVALEAKLMSTAGIHFGPKDPSDPQSWTGQEDLFGLVMNMLSGTPAPPPVRAALYKVAASIPGVTVKGQYTDSMGRTGTAIQLGIMTMVVDPTTGQYLDGMWGMDPDATNCSKSTGMCQSKTRPGMGMSGPISTMLITQGPATGLPKIVGGPTGSAGGGLGQPTAAPPAAS
jgi:hypothetical protein